MGGAVVRHETADVPGWKSGRAIGIALALASILCALAGPVTFVVSVAIMFNNSDESLMLLSFLLIAMAVPLAGLARRQGPKSGRTRGLIVAAMAIAVICLAVVVLLFAALIWALQGDP
jgi:hypothetical protein